MKLQPKQYYKLFARPVVVITTISENGEANAAPYSFDSPVSMDPPIFGLSTFKERDTWKNIYDNGEFVINVCGQELGPHMKVLGKKYPYGTNELKEAGLTEVQSSKVKPPRIADALGWLECKLHAYHLSGDHIWVEGEVVDVEVNDKYCGEDGFDIVAANPLQHVSGTDFMRDIKKQMYER